MLFGHSRLACVPELYADLESPALQRYAVWFGGSLLGVSPGFSSLLISKADYYECGPGVTRSNAVYRDW